MITLSDDEWRAINAKLDDLVALATKCAADRDKYRAALERIAANESVGIDHDGSSEAWAREALA